VDGRKKERKKREKKKGQSWTNHNVIINRLIAPSFSLPDSTNGEFPSSSSPGPGMDITYHIPFCFLVSRIAIAIAIANSPWMNEA
jgi:hypothetical protein